MLEKRLNAFSVCWQLILIELKMLFKDIWNSFLDVLIIVGSSVFCNAYILPKMGVSLEYGALIAVGWISSIGIFEAFDAGVLMVVDYENNRTSSFELMLPLPAWMVFFKTAVARACKAATIASLVLPLSKLMIWPMLDLTYFSLGKFIFGYFLVNMFIGSLAIFAASLTEASVKATRVWVRFFHPMWMFGGSIFPYKATVQAFPWLSKFLLLNPFVHTTEILYSSVLPSSCYFLNFFQSAIGLMIFSFLFFVFGFCKLRRRLDFV